jgi:hypothetical protein
MNSRIIFFRYLLCFSVPIVSVPDRQPGGANRSGPNELMTRAALPPGSPHAVQPKTEIQIRSAFWTSISGGPPIDHIPSATSGVSKGNVDRVEFRPAVGPPDRAECAEYGVRACIYKVLWSRPWSADLVPDAT